jgi:phosphoglycerate dehydrogenase-like enzyme
LALGATLDVFAQKPLPQDSRVWTLGNVFITPHISGNTAGYGSLVTIISVDNLTRYTYDKRLLNEAEMTPGCRIGIRLAECSR